jgi:hypothetical protein
VCLSGGERTPSPGCRSSWVEAEGSLTREALGRAGSGPDNDGTCRYCQRVRVRQARREGVREKPVLTFRKRRTGSNLVDMGRGVVRDRWDGWAVDSEAGEFRRWGAMVKVCGVAVAMLPGQSWASLSSIGTS